MSKKRREYMMAPFRPELDNDIREKYFAIPEGKRSDTLRDAFRLYSGLTKKLVFEPTERPIAHPSNNRPLIMKQGVKR